MTVIATYPKGDLRRMLAVLAAIEATPDATLVKVAARTGLDKKTVTHLVAQAGEQAGVTLTKTGPIYTLDDWGPVFNPAGAHQALAGTLKAPGTQPSACVLDSATPAMGRQTGGNDLWSAVWPCELILPLGHGWVACTDALPWNDYQGELEYIVYSPAYGGDLHRCTFSLSGARWYDERQALGISGVTHWRLARRDEPRDSTLDGPPPTATQVDAERLALLHRWWEWYRHATGIEPA